MSGRHTPGPWHIGDIPLRDDHISITTSDYGIAKVWNSPDGDGEVNRANARLIAAAPELLEALEMLAAGDPDVSGTALIYDADIGSLLARARAAIQKATS